MCLIHERSEPHNKSNVRYKFLEVKDGKYYSPSFFSNGKEWLVGKTRKAQVSNNPPLDAQGFHVYVTREDARGAANDWKKRNEFQYVVVKLIVNHFVSGGTISACDSYSDGKRGEVWKHATVVEVSP